MDFDPRDDDSRDNERHGTTASRDGRSASDDREHDHHWCQPDMRTRARDDDARGRGTYVGLGRDDRGSAFNFFADGIGGFRPVEMPPIFGSANLRFGEISDFDVERSAHSRLRISARRSFKGVV